MHNLPRIQAIVKKLFRRLNGAKRKNIAANLCMLAAGRKPCVLWDFCAFQADIVSALCSECLEGETGVIFKLEDDYFLCKKADLIRQLASSLDNPPVFIDIAGHSPTMCSSDTVMLILDWVRNLLHAVEASLLAYQTGGQQKCQESVPILALVSRPEWNLSTLFGVLLGYPVVYWFPKFQDQYCLSNGDLKVYSVELDGASVISFSVPHALVLQQQNSLQHLTEELGSLQHPTEQLGSLQHLTEELGSLQHPTKQLGSLQHPTKQLGSLQHPTKQLGSLQHPTEQLGSLQHPTEHFPNHQRSVSVPYSVVTDSQRENSIGHLKDRIDKWVVSLFPELVYERLEWNRSFELGDVRLKFESKIINQPVVTL